MPNPTGKNTQLTPDELARAVAAFTAAAGNISEGARLSGTDRNTFRRHVERAVHEGLLTADLGEKSASWTREQVTSARARVLRLYQDKVRKGDWRKPVMIRMRPEPFILKVFGDPHLDAAGCDFDLFDRHFRELDGVHVHGVCVGDWFNNWTRSLAHLWKGEGDPSDAWLLFEDLMEAHGGGLLAACSGNHDDWTHAPADPIDMLMKRHGVVYRVGAVRIMLAFEGLDPIGVSIRHKWRGGSMYSPAHAINRAAMMGWRDHLMIGGHIHQDEPRMRVSPDGFVSHICQVSAFKRFDGFADVQGYMPHTISPVWTLVVDPRRGDTDPDKIKVFWDSMAARYYLEAIS